jgi:hypothetical protein
MVGPLCYWENTCGSPKFNPRLNFHQTNPFLGDNLSELS